MRPTHLCGSLKGLVGIERRKADHHTRRGFRQLRAPGNIIRNSPTCCLWLGLIMLMRESPVSPMMEVTSYDILFKEVYIKVPAQYYLTELAFGGYTG